jgi:hypothetical protein
LTGKAKPRLQIHFFDLLGHMRGAVVPDQVQNAALLAPSGTSSWNIVRARTATMDKAKPWLQDYGHLLEGRLSLLACKLKYPDNLQYLAVN